MRNILKQEAFEKCWAHSSLRAAARPLTRCRCCRTRASMSTTTTTTTTKTTTTRDRGDRYGPIEWAQLQCSWLDLRSVKSWIYSSVNYTCKFVGLPLATRATVERLWWYEFVNTHLYHSRQLYNIHLNTNCSSNSKHSQLPALRSYP